MSRWPRARTAVPALFTLLALALVAPGAVAAETNPSDPVPTDLSDGEWEFLLELDGDGDGHWQLTFELPVTTDEEEAAFTDLADEFEDGDIDLQTVTAFERAAERVDARTTRSMNISNHQRSSHLDAVNDTAWLNTSFTWNAFARVDGESLHIDDVLETNDGLWLDGLGPDMTLRISPPEEYAVFDATTSPQDGELRWEGPQEFDANSLVVEFRGGGNDEPSEDLTLLFVVVGGIVFLIVLAVAYLTWRYRHRLGALVSGEETPAATDDGPAADATATDDDAPAGQTAGGPSPDTPATGTGEAGAEESAAADGTAAGTDVVAEELLSDEERVERLLEENGGRMKQAQIVTETDWSNAKVSQLLSKMEDDGRIDKLRIGRENLISFPEMSLTDSGPDDPDDDGSR